MSRHVSCLALFAVLCLVVVRPADSSNWATSAEVNNPVSVEHSRQENSVAVADGCGGVIVTWQDLRNELYFYVYAQRISANGDPLWTVDGVRLSTQNSNQQFPRIVADGTGGAIVIWSDQRTDVSDLYAQRIDAGGNVLWTPTGVPVAVAANSQTEAAAIADGAGGAIICWTDLRTASDIYAQRVDASGAVLWAANGAPVSATGSVETDPALATDGAGGAIIAWTDFRNNALFPDVYAQRMAGTGAPMWAANGISVATALLSQRDAAVSYSMSSGAYVVWEDFRDGVDYHIYGQRLLHDGTPVFAANGIKVSALAGGDNVDPQIVDSTTSLATSEGRIAYVLWRHITAGGDQELIFSYLSLTDFLPFEYPISFGLGDKLDPHLAPNGKEGGVLVSWSSDRFGTRDIYVTKHYGSYLFSSSGRSISSAVGVQGPSHIVPDSEGGAIVVWDDYRKGPADPDIFAQRMDFNGTLGYASADIAGIVDNPQDQGREVVVTWTRSRIDIPPAGISARYSVWRRNQNPASPSGLDLPAVILDGRVAKAVAAGIGPLLASEQVAAGWELVGTSPSVHLPAYAMTAPTYGDSTGSGIPYTGFLVLYETEFGIYTSAPDSGFSVDDLAPEAPLELMGTTLGSDARLDWDLPPATPDVVAYNLYRSPLPGVAVAPGNLLVSVPDLTHLDATTGGILHYYVVTAVDDAAQEGPPSNEVAVPQGAGGIPSPFPTALSVRAAGPNPARQRASFSYGLPAAADVSIKVYDVNGRRVASDRPGPQSRGWHAYEFGGRDGRGRSVQGGVYFLEVRAGSARDVLRFVLLP